MILLLKDWGNYFYLSLPTVFFFLSSAIQSQNLKFFFFSLNHFAGQTSVILVAICMFGSICGLIGWIKRMFATENCGSAMLHSLCLCLPVMLHNRTCHCSTNGHTSQKFPAGHSALRFRAKICMQVMTESIALVKISSNLQGCWLLEAKFMCMTI